MATKVLLDTNILIAAFRRNEKAVEFLGNKSYIFFISDITIMEIFAGCHTVRKRKEFEQIMKFYGRAPLTSTSADKALSLIKRYSVQRFSLQIPDILIAATAIHYNLPLKSLNIKDFDFIRELELI